MSVEISLLLAVKALIELAGFVLFSQGALYLMLGAERERSFLYRLFRVLAAPLLRATRALAPAYVGDRPIPYLAVLLLLWAWLLLVFWLAPELCSRGALECGAVQ